MAARDAITAQGFAHPAPTARRSGRDATGIEARQVARRAAAHGLMVLMVLGSFGLWTAIPLGGLWLAAQLTDSYTELSAAPALVAIVGIPAAMAFTASALARLERLYMRVTGATTRARAPAWRRSVSDSSSGPASGVLDKIMVASVLAAVIAFVGWFLLFAGAASAAQAASEKTVVLTAPFMDARTFCGGTYCVATADEDTGMMQAHLVDDFGEAQAGILATHNLSNARSLKYRATFEVESLSATGVIVGMSHTTTNLGSLWFFYECQLVPGWQARKQVTLLDKEVTLEWTVSNPARGTQYLSACLRASGQVGFADATLTRIEAIIGR